MNTPKIQIQSNSLTLAKRAPKAKQSKPRAIAQTNFAILERSAIQAALDTRFEQCPDLLRGWQSFFDAEYDVALTALAEKRYTKTARKRMMERDAAMRRAKQIAGLYLWDMLYELRNLVADQLAQEFKSNGAKDAAELIRDMNPQIEAEQVA